MKDLGIKTRVILLGTVPALLFAIILAGYAISNIFNVLDQSLHDRGRIIASQLAPAAEYGVISGNYSALKQLAKQALDNERELKSVLITDRDGSILATSGPKIPEAIIAKFIDAEGKDVQWADGLLFSAPINRSLVEIDDFTSVYENASVTNNIYTSPLLGHVYIVHNYLTLQNLKKDMIFKVLLIGIIGLLVSAYMAWRIGRSITNPIQEIAFAVNKVGEGTFAHMISENSSGELKVLQQGFNSMSLSLKQAYDHMQDKIHEATKLLRYQAQHDDLTGLINRREFEVRLERCLKSAQDYNLEHILCYLDLDQFKLVNDTCGHHAGDELLKQVSALLANRIRDRDTLARLGGDEFGLLLASCTIESAHQICNELLRLVRDYRFISDDKVFAIGVSIGLVVINSSFTDLSSVMHAADAACYSAKTAGRNQSFLYTHGNAEMAQRQSAVAAVSNMTGKIEDEQFILYCQPIMALSSANSNQQHYEILIRKINIDGGLILPAAFITSAERYHLMPNIDRWVIKNTFIAYREMLDMRKNQVSHIFSINLSGTSLGDKSLLGYIREQLSIYAIPAAAICFEITETAAIVNLNNTIHLIKALKKLGCQFALDDFGSGMSSFMYLKSLGVDFLKIDGSFVKEMHINKIDHAMVRSIHSVAESMGIQTVAEFVENKAILTELEKIGVHFGQGFYLGKPIELKRLVNSFSTPKA